MSYSFKVDRLYRMPTHFGPSLGPRQGPNGRRYTNLETPNCLSTQVIFEADPMQLEKLLPPRFNLREPYAVSLSFDYMKDIEWLAGRAYNTFGVSVPAVYQGQRNVVNGDLQLVLWENMADPIITGREDLGLSKVYCELPEPQFIGEDVICRASWDGCQFFTLELSNLNEGAPQNNTSINSSEGGLFYKYMPKSTISGSSDAEYPTFIPAESPNVTVDHAMFAKNASAQFRHCTWEELPTLVNIVNALSKLTLGDCLEATIIKSHGGKDLSDQKILT